MAKRRRPDTAPASTDAVFDGPSELAALMRSRNWSVTSLGAPVGWSPSLRTIVRMMLASRYQMWMGWGPDLNFFYNDAYRPTLGVKHARALGAPAREVWAEIWDAIGPRIQHVLDTGDATWDEGLLLFLERNGYPEETYHTFSYSPVFEDDGAIGGMLCVVTEETERIVSERRLGLVRDFSSRLSTTSATAEVMASMADVLRVESRDLPFTLTYLLDEGTSTAMLVAQTGMPGGHPAAMSELNVVTDGVWPVAEVLSSLQPVIVSLAALAPVLPSGFTWPAGPWTVPPSMAIVMPIAQQGQSRPAGLFIAGVNPHRPFDASYQSFLSLFVGQVAAGLANARAYEGERRRAEALAELDRAKTVFFSNASHEFRTPLTLMLGPIADLATRESLEPEVRQELELVQRSGDRLLRLVNTLLDFSRIEAGRAQAQYEPLDLAEYTRDLVSVFESATERAGLRLVVDCPPLGVPVYVDRTMWEKVVLNLVSNAFKFTMDGEIVVSLRCADDQVQLSVRDTGSGIPAHELPRLFERFHRVEGARGRTQEGTGIGLALANELVKLHGGMLQVESVEGEGSTFTVTIPLGTDHLPQERLLAAGERASASVASRAFIEEAVRWLPDGGSEPAEITTGAPAHEESTADAGMPAGRRARILVADDNADMRGYLQRLLGTRWNLTVVSNGREALESLKAGLPALVITDVMMPELDGFGLVAAIRRDALLRDVPVMMLSARAGDESRLEGLEAGADDYVVKPFSARELIARIETQILRAEVRTLEEAQRERMAEVFRQAPAAIAILRGPEHVYDLANSAYLALVGNRAILGLPIREALPELENQGIYELLDEVYRTGRPHEGRALRVMILQQEGSPLQEYYFDFIYQPIVDSDGQVDAIAVVVFDVTELAKAKAEAVAASRAKDEFLAMLGHELRNPLAPIMTAVQLMRLRGITAAEREQTIIERQVRRLMRLVDDLLDVSRVTRGKVDLRLERLEVAQVVARAVETVSPLIEQERHALTINVPREGLVVEGDSARLEQVIANLLTNAAKYTPSGGRIAVSAHAQGGDVVLMVNDSGAGIGADLLPKVFDLFAQGPQAVDRSPGGLGIGLALVKSLVGLHGGSVVASSDGPGLGSTFTVRLPRAATETAPLPAVPVMLSATMSAALAGTVGDAGGGRKVLIVDDNEDAAEVLAASLSACGFRTKVAHDSASALRAAADFEPDVAILDIGLPVMDGYELAQRFAEDPRLRQTRLIALTGYGLEHDRLRSQAAGFERHLVKPVDILELRDALID